MLPALIDKVVASSYVYSPFASVVVGFDSVVAPLPYGPFDSVVGGFGRGGRRV